MMSLIVLAAASVFPIVCSLDDSACYQRQYGQAPSDPPAQSNGIAPKRIVELRAKYLKCGSLNNSITSAACYDSTRELFDPPRDMLEDKVPVIDVNFGCAIFRGGMSNNEYAGKLCLQREQEAYDTLKETWANISLRAKSECVARVSSYLDNGMAYRLQDRFYYTDLLQCIAREDSQDDVQRQGPFRP